MIELPKGQDDSSIGQLADRMFRTFRASDLARPQGTILAIEEELRGSLCNLPDLLARVDLIVDVGDALLVTDFKTDPNELGGCSGRRRRRPAPALQRTGAALGRWQATQVGVCVLTKTKVPSVSRHPVEYDSRQIERHQADRGKGLGRHHGRALLSQSVTHALYFMSLSQSLQRLARVTALSPRRTSLWLWQKLEEVVFTETGALYRPGNGHVIVYQKAGGIYYHRATPQKVLETLELVRSSRQRIRIYYGDAHSGRDWLEEWDVEGTIGCSMGPLKVPLLIKTPRSLGGPAILDHCIVQIKLAGQRGGVLYRHPHYHTGAPFNSRAKRPGDVRPGQPTRTGLQPRRGCKRSCSRTFSLAQGRGRLCGEDDPVTSGIYPCVETSPSCRLRRPY